ncbi:hypothetical protein EVAR_65727_1 [Eumeta japonica]|uniref:Uncharacterized protein n=1 Tax=Eumeta variegata TaxID=151549 RepID=A0A4C2A770_EUMVA|nr:hypothetical protein EVAR_65727_1 [Eumeta japonica]
MKQHSHESRLRQKNIKNATAPRTRAAVDALILCRRDSNGRYKSVVNLLEPCKKFKRQASAPNLCVCVSMSGHRLKPLNGKCNDRDEYLIRPLDTKERRRNKERNGTRADVNGGRARVVRLGNQSCGVLQVNEQNKRRYAHKDSNLHDTIVYCYVRSQCVNRGLRTVNDDEKIERNHMLRRPSL